MQSSREIAVAATFQSFVNCYLREVNAGVAVIHRTASGSIGAIEWTLRRQQAILRAEVTSASLCGAQHFSRLWSRSMSDVSWRQIERIPALHLLVHETYRDLDGAPVDALRGFELELLMRLLDSYQQTSLYVATATPYPANEGDFIEAEQSLWLYPTPKSRQGMMFWQQKTYSPELRGHFRLHYFGAKSRNVRHASAWPMQAPEIVHSLLGGGADQFDIGGDEYLLPMHPLQTEALRLDPEIQAMQREGTDGLERVSLAWFERYLACAVEPLIRLCDDHGVALKAHQQNNLLDVGTGYPTASYYRDNQIERQRPTRLTVNF